MKYMLMMNGPRDSYDQFAAWSKEMIQAHIAFMRDIAGKLTRQGEWAGGEGLASPHEAKLVRIGKNGRPVTDGIFPETKEYLSGFWIVDVPSAERAYEIAAEISTAPHPDALDFWIEVRQVLSAPPM